MLRICPEFAFRKFRQFDSKKIQENALALKCDELDEKMQAAEKRKAELLKKCEVLEDCLLDLNLTEADMNKHRAALKKTVRALS